MLSDQDREIEILRHVAQKQVQGMNAAGRRAYGDNLGRFGRASGERLACSRGCLCRSHPFQRAYLAKQACLVIIVEAAGARLEHRVGCAKRKRLDGSFGSISGEGRYYEHLGVGCRFHNLGKCFDTPHARHFEIEEHDMRAGCGQLCNAAFRSAGGPDDNHVVCQLDHARKYGAHGQRIVDDHDPHRVGARPGR